MKPIICVCGFAYDGDKFLTCPAVNHRMRLGTEKARLEAEKEETRRGELIAEVLSVKKNKEGRYKTTWGDKTALGLYRTVQRLIEEGK